MKKILIIDDEADVCFLIKQNLEVTKKYEVITATSGKGGLAAAFREKPDLIILDIIMPEMGGLEVLRKLRAADEAKHIPVIILTAVGREQTRQGAESLGVEGYLVKPVESDILVGAIDKVFAP